MRRYSRQIIEKAKRLRATGKTYGEIRVAVGMMIPKSTLSEWCRGVRLPKNYIGKISKLNTENLGKGRWIAVEINRIKRKEFFEKISKLNMSIARRISDKEIAKIALAMLCLGEASKYNPKGRRTFSLGSSDKRIIILFLQLLRRCFNFDLEKVRCAVQCRADQDVEALEKYWLEATKVPKRLFYKARIDPRTVGKPTKNKCYMGVLNVDYFDTKVQLELESLSDLLYNSVAK